ncbi:MAG: hypothetical protein L0Y58_04740 [Verrucomicrobia subdivision 3 bacterium]|nr:hypothetical protein [Limisphaerales bacterium]
MILHALALAFYDHGFGVVQESIEDGGSDGGVVVEDFRPVFEDAVGREEDGPPLIAVAAMIWNGRSAPVLSSGK